MAVAYSNLQALCFRSPTSSWSMTSTISAVDSSSKGRLSFLARHASTYLSSAYLFLCCLKAALGQSLYHD